VDENRSAHVATLPLSYIYMCTYFTQKSVSGIASELSFAEELHLISMNSSYKLSGRMFSLQRTFHSGSSMFRK